MKYLATAFFAAIAVFILVAGNNNLFYDYCEPGRLCEKAVLADIDIRKTYAEAELSKNMYANENARRAQERQDLLAMAKAEAELMRARNAGRPRQPYSIRQAMCGGGMGRCGQPRRVQWRVVQPAHSGYGPVRRPCRGNCW